MVMRFPPVHALAAFDAAARLGSFAQAAEELCITPSALSHRIRLLEEFLGGRLFIRDTRAIILTDFGRRYLDVVREALRTLGDFPMPRSQQAREQHPTRVKITLPPTFARCLFMPRIGGFRKAHPEIELEVYLSVPLYDLALRETDVEVRFGAGKYPDLVTEKLFEEPAFAAASRDYLSTIPPLRVPGDLRHAALLRSALEPWQPWFEAAGLDWPEPTGELRTDDLGLLLEGIRLGYGVGLTRLHFARDMLASGELVRLFDVEVAAPLHSYYIVYEQEAAAVPGVNTLLGWMREHLSHS